MTATPKDMQPSHVELGGIELAPTTTGPDIPHLSEKVVDGDEALKVLQVHFEPFTPQEEKRVKWKIDRRMVVLMLFINGLQFVDKNVSCNSPRFILNIRTDTLERLSDPLQPMVCRQKPTWLVHSTAFWSPASTSGTWLLSIRLI